MGRSVSYLSHASKIAYFKCPEIEYPEDFQYQVIEIIQDSIMRVFPSIEVTDRWAGREDHIICENGHAEIAVSEYCGLCSLSIRVRQDSEHPEISEHWINQIWPRLEKEMIQLFENVYQKVGTFSNGESVYEKISAGK